MKSLTSFIKIVLFFTFYFIGSVVYAQEISIELGGGSVPQNGAYKIKLLVKNDRLKNYSVFPEIQGFRKGGVSSFSNMNIINGRVSQSEGVTQTYYPEKEGTFTLKPFKMKVNGQVVSSQGITIKVEPAQQQQNDPYDPFSGFFSDPFSTKSQQQKQQPREFEEVEEDAFFAITTNKSEVYAGEGFAMTMAFYVALTNRAQMEFHKPEEQLSNTLKKVKPTNCWEENFQIDQIKPEYVTIGGKKYRQYKVYQAVFFPFGPGEIKIPSVGWEMVKYKEAKRKSFWGRNLQKDFKVFRSKAKTIKVKPLPPHPLREQVNVGNFRLKEYLDSDQQKTGDSFLYGFEIKGQGNIAAIKEPNTSDNDDFVFYPPSVNQGISRDHRTVVGNKLFKYYVEPQEPGNFPMKEYLQWVYFDPVKEVYDTLQPTVLMRITGESARNAAIAKNDLGGFYSDREEVANNTLRNTEDKPWLNYVANLVIILILATGVFFAVKK